jgi:hypothetical protein
MPQDRLWQSRGIYSRDGFPVSPGGLWLKVSGLQIIVPDKCSAAESILWRRILAPGFTSMEPQGGTCLTTPAGQPLEG